MQPRLHRQEIAEGDLSLGRIRLVGQVLGEEGGDRLIHTLEIPLREGDPRQGRQDRLGDGFDVGGRLCRAALVVLVDERLPLTPDQEAVEVGERVSAKERLCDQGAIEPPRGYALPRLGFSSYTARLLRQRRRSVGAGAGEQGEA